MRKQNLRSGLLFLLVLAVSLVNTGWAQGAHDVARGAPGSQDFGFGAVIYPNGLHLDQALQLAHDLRFDWLFVPVSWAAAQSAPSAALRLDSLEPIMKFASERQIAVMVSVGQAPAWGLTKQGPDAAQAASFVAALAQRYPVVQAVELFPGANTAAGWGSSPNPQAYANLLSVISVELARSGRSLIVVAGGLRPLGPAAAASDMEDLVFLQGLYNSGAASWMPVVSIQYPAVTSEPLKLSTPAERRVFRHFEDIRQVMTANQHSKGKIWITHFQAPSGKINPSDAVYQELNAQTSWFGLAYPQVRSQLYVGVAALQSLNPGIDPGGNTAFSLIDAAGNKHPFCAALKQMIEQNQAGNTVIRPGKPKEGNFNKPKS